MVALLFTMGLGIAIGYAVWNSASRSSVARPHAAPPSTSAPGAPTDAAAIAKNVDPGLVDVNTSLPYQGLKGAGTGMVLTSDGVVLTNNHVVEGATTISVTDVGNGHTYNASVLGYDRSQDVALLKLSGATGLKTVNLSTTPAQRQDAVVAIGNANGTGGTPTYNGGSITATNQSITAEDAADGSTEQLNGLLETNANIIEGDSGGPLVNASGGVVGMDTAGSNSFQFQQSGNQGYAIPVGTADSIAKQIQAGQSSSTVHLGATAFLGVEVQDGGGNGGPKGAQIVSAVPNGPAAAAGLGQGDTITSVAGQAVTSAGSLTNVMLTQHPNTTVQVQYVNSSGQQQTAQVQLSSGPAQ